MSNIRDYAGKSVFFLSRNGKVQKGTVVGIKSREGLLMIQKITDGHSTFTAVTVDQVIDPDNVSVVTVDDRQALVLWSEGISVYVCFVDAPTEYRWVSRAS